MQHTSYPVAVIPGDGIGPELVEAALSVLAAVGSRHGFSLSTTTVDGGAAAYLRDGVPMTPEAIEVVRRSAATLKGPVGLPEVRLPDGTEAGLLGGVLRNGLDLWANVRPIKLLPGIESRVRAEPGDIDYVIVRENTEGLYLARGRGVGNERAMTDTLLVTRHGCERIARYAFELAARRSGAPADGGHRVTLVDKANVLRSMFFFREVFLEVAAQYPDIEAECLYVDAAAQALVMRPEHFDVIVTENLFGDILSDLGGGTVGGIAMCPSGNVGGALRGDPARRSSHPADPAYFEPIHGSAPAIAGRGLANPLSQILAAAMMLDHLGERAGGDDIRDATSAALAAGDIQIRRDGSAIGGPDAVSRAVVAHLRGGAPEVEREPSTP
ncbi:isocitrate/isopropylmalate dehydrogenase family protein [Rugosimonospora acidiphila]|uniref:Isocitrate/isopropylmalate dehydrogenase family protein n=1 Tax=Rugosimonospora acidiphila TaxID=556531 RepID=A0ABP9SGY0_9ACTN